MVDKLKARLRLRRLPLRYSPHVFGVMQSGLTTAMASAIATFGALGLSVSSLSKWLLAWMIGWATVMPVVILLAPRLKRFSERLVAAEEAPSEIAQEHERL